MKLKRIFLFFITAFVFSSCEKCKDCEPKYEFINNDDIQGLYELAAALEGYSSFNDMWNSDDSISESSSKLGLNHNDIEKKRTEAEQSLIDEIKLNQKEQLEAGHHGVPLTVYKDKFFFGQDRFNDLLGALKDDGLEL